MQIIIKFLPMLRSTVQFVVHNFGGLLSTEGSYKSHWLWNLKRITFMLSNMTSVVISMCSSPLSFFQCLMSLDTSLVFIIP